jgi:hypothetical protein
VNRLVLAKLVGAWWWLVLRLTGYRCPNCDRLLALHAPWQEYRCNRTPLRYQITDAGRALAAGDEMTIEPAVGRLVAHL